MAVVCRPPGWDRGLMRCLSRPPITPSPQVNDGSSTGHLRGAPGWRGACDRRGRRSRSIQDDRQSVLSRTHNNHLRVWRFRELFRGLNSLPFDDLTVQSFAADLLIIRYTQGFNVLSYGLLLGPIKHELHFERLLLLFQLRL